MIRPPISMKDCMKRSGHTPCSTLDTRESMNKHCHCGWILRRHATTAPKAWWLCWDGCHTASGGSKWSLCELKPWSPTRSRQDWNKQTKKNATGSSLASSDIEELKSSETGCSLVERGNEEETTSMLRPVRPLQWDQTLVEWVPPSQRDI